MKQLLTLALILLPLLSCQRSPETNQDQKKPTVLKDYVQQPLKKSREVGKEAEERNKKLNEALDF